MPGVKGKSGQRYKPTQAKQLAGTLRPERVNPNEPAGPVLGKMPPCPSHLNGEARKTWSKFGRALIEMGVLTWVDLHGLAAYCVVHARWLEVETQLQTYGVMLSQDGRLFPSPYLKIAEDCLKQMRAWMTEFGITPSSRSRVTATKAKPTKVEGDDWFGVNNRN